MRLWLVLAAIAFALVGICLPPEATVRALTGADAAHRVDVAEGVWILKALLIVHAIAALLLLRVRATHSGVAPLWTLRGAAPERPRAAERTIVLAILLLAGVLRLYDIGDQLWFDEILTLVRYVRRPIGYVLTTYDSANQHMLYSLLAHVAVAIFGESNAALRLPAAIFGVASLWALWSFARLVTERVEGLFAIAFLAVSYHHVWFSQNARGYTGLLFFTLVGSTALLRMLTSREVHGPGLAIGYGIAMSLAVATHLTALFAVAGHGLLWLALVAVARRRRLPPEHWLPAIGFALTASLSLLCYALVLPQFGGTMASNSLAEKATLWKSANWIVAEALSGVASGVPGGSIALVVGAVIAALGVWSVLRQSVGLLALYVGGALVTLGSFLGTHQPIWPRYFFLSAGFAVLVLIRGLFTLCEKLSIGRPNIVARRVGALAATLLCLVAAATLPRAYAPKQDFEGALVYIRSMAEPGDAVTAFGSASFPYREFFRADWSRSDTVADLQALEARHPRTWVVYTMRKIVMGEHPEVRRWLRDHYEEARVFPATVGGGEVVVCVRR